MAKTFLCVVNLDPVASLPGSGNKGDMVVLAGDGHLYVHNGTTWVDHGATGGGGGSATIYTATVDFGAGASTTVKTTVANGAVSGASVIALCGHKAGAGRPVDEAEMEPLVSSIGSVGSGTFDVFTHAPQGGAHGQYVLSYMIG